jgi:hypothetical protein
VQSEKDGGIIKGGDTFSLVGGEALSVSVFCQRIFYGKGVIEGTK